MTFRPNSEKTVFASQSEKIRRRRERAVERQKARSERSDQQQLDKLIFLGYENCREAVRLRNKLSTKE